jgi:uncharacterized OB-fold protein
MAWGIVGLAMLAAAAVIWKRTQTRTVTRTVHRVGSGSPSTVPATRLTPRPEALPVRSCPVCHSEYAPQNRFCVRDGAPLTDGPVSGPFSHGMICPTCRRGYAPDASFCPEDSDELMPYGLYGAASATRPPMPLDGNKICPECGVQHVGGHIFCGHDGAELVVVN